MRPALKFPILKETSICFRKSNFNCIAKAGSFQDGPAFLLVKADYKI